MRKMNLPNASARALVCALLIATGVACDNGDAGRAQAEAEKAKLEAELAKAKAEVEIAKAQASAAASQNAQAETNDGSPDAPAGTVTGGEAEGEPPKAANVEATVTVQVPQQKADGKPWDAMGGAPDVIVMLAAKSGTVQSAKVQDKFGGTFKMPSLELTPGDTVRITVVDADAMQHDPIGNATVVYKGPRSRATFGGAISGSVEF